MINKSIGTKPTPHSKAWLALVNVAVAFILLCITGAGVRADWIEIETPHFIVYSQKKEKTTRAFLAELETFRAFIEQVTGTNPRIGSLRLKVVIFKRKRGYRKVSQSRKTGGLFGLHRDGPVALLYFRDDKSTFAQQGRQVLFHEYLHFFQYLMRPTGYPLWYREGFAEYVSSSKIENSSMFVGEVLNARLPSLVRERWYPLKDLLEVDKIPARGDIFYGQAWLFTHMLYANIKLSKDRARFLEMLVNGVTPELASKAAFNLDLDQLDAALRRYFKTGKLSAFIFPLRVPELSFSQTRKLSRKDGQLLELDLMADFANDRLKHKVALKQVKKLQKLHSKNPSLEAANLKLLSKTEDWDKAKKHAHILAEQYPTDPRINAVAGETLLRRQIALMQVSKRRRFDLEELAIISSYLKKAVNSNPKDALSRYWLAKTFAFGYRDQTIDYVELVLEAYKLYPQYRSIRYQLAFLLVEHQEYQKACQLLKPLHQSEKRAESRLRIELAVARFDEPKTCPLVTH